MRSNFVTAEKLSSGLPARKPLARAGRRRDYSASIGRLARIDTVTLWSTAKLIAAKVANRIAMTDGQMILPRPLSGRVYQRKLDAPGLISPSLNALTLSTYTMGVVLLSP
jgi:hypothetical protein